jgi:hypothetical protein
MASTEEVVERALAVAHPRLRERCIEAKIITVLVDECGVYDIEGLHALLEMGFDIVAAKMEEHGAAPLGFVTLLKKNLVSSVAPINAAGGSSSNAAAEGASSSSPAMSEGCSDGQPAPPPESVPNADDAPPRSEMAVPVEIFAVEVDEHDQRSDGSALVEVAVVSQLLDTPHRKRKQRKNTHISSEEAVAQAAREGLVFVKSATSISGYAGVTVDNRKDGGSVPYAAYAPGGKTKGHFLGCFQTAEEAALTYARHVANTVERTVDVHAGPSDEAKERLTEAHNYLAVCKNPSCGALVCILSATRDARARRAQDTYAPGDGCASPTCGAGGSNIGRFKERQLRMANELLTGGKKLIEWPSGPGPPGRRRGAAGFNKIARDLVLNAAQMHDKAQAVLAKQKSR